MPLRFKCVCGRTGRMRVKTPRVSKASREHFERFADEFSKRKRVTIEKGRKKRRIEKNTRTFHPNFRGIRQKLILPRHEDPCEFCANARYNRTCGMEKDCIPYNYRMTCKVESRLSAFKL